MSVKPLSGVRILDLTRVASGPFATMQLGDLGADIIKIEEPTQGDESRTYGPPFAAGESAYFLSVNRNKRSCAVDLKHPRGLELIRSLVPKFDVVIENFRPGTAKRLGVDYEELSKLNPTLIYCSITGFGTSGPNFERPGYDLIVQGESGVMEITGERDGAPMKVGTSVADLITGLYASQGILTALVDRSRTGRGCTVNISMLDSLASLLTFNAGIYFTTGQSPSRRGNEHPTISPYETFKASDGWLNLGIANDKFWQLFCECAGAKELADDPRFKNAPERVKFRTELKPLVAEIISCHTRDHWIELLAKTGIPCGAIRTIAEVCESEQLVSRGMVISMQHPTAGMVRNIDSPIRINDKNATDDTPPPLLGGNTREVLMELLGMSEDEIQDLIDQRTVRCTDRLENPGGVLEKFRSCKDS